MFIKKDLRKIPRILEDAALEGDTEIRKDNDGSEPSSKRSKRDVLTELKLARRSSEFNGSLKILCQPKNAPSLSNLVSLSVYDCQIKSLEGIGFLGSTVGNEGKICCPNLKTLNLGRNPIQTLPKELSAFRRSLKELWCDDCNISGPLPSCVFQLDQLELLQMANNKITEIPSSIERLQRLKSLCMDRNEIVEVPREIGRMGSLEAIMLRNNQIRQLPEGIPGAHMTSLVLVHVSSNKLETLPDSVVECPSLEALYANGNEISGLPTGIGTRLTNLKRLNLSNNKIHVLPLDLTERFGEPDPTSGLCDKDSNCVVYVSQNPIGDEEMVDAMESKQPVAVA